MYVVRLKSKTRKGGNCRASFRLTVDRPKLTERKNRKAILRQLAAAVDELRQDAKAKGIDKMPMSEINRAVAAARADLRKKQARKRAGK